MAPKTTDYAEEFAVIPLPVQISITLKKEPRIPPISRVTTKVLLNESKPLRPHPKRGNRRKAGQRIPPPKKLPHESLVRPPVETKQYDLQKVAEYLNYMEDVKQKLQNKPGGYDEFKDILIIFTSHISEVPLYKGIDRVVNLLKEHPDLIVGFSRFLRPGYRIEVDVNKNGYAETVSINLPTTIQPKYVALPPLAK